MRSGLGLVLAVGALGSSLATAAEPATEWSRFRGPNGSGISSASRVPTEFGPTKNVLWRLELPQGHSSPILLGDRIYLTAFRGDDVAHLSADLLEHVL